MRNQVIFLSVIASIGVISGALSAPALPFIADHFSANFSSIQFTISLFLLGNAFGQLICGPLSDQIGQRFVLLGGLVLYILASCSCALSGQMSLLLLARFFQGMGSSVGPVLARAIASNRYSSERSAQVQSYGAMGVGLATILATLSSGQLTLVSWRGNFWLAAGLGVLLFLWTRGALHAPLSSQSHPISWRHLFSRMLHIIKHPHFFGSMGCHSLTYGLMYAYISLFPFFLIERFYENNPARISFYAVYMIMGYMGGTFLAAKLVVRWSSTRLIAIGLSLQLIAGMMLFAVLPSPLFLAALFLFNLGIGFILPLTAAAALAPFARESVGAASSCLGLSYRLIGSGLSALICLCPLDGGRNLGWVMILLSVGSLILFRSTIPIVIQESDLG